MAILIDIEEDWLPEIKGACSRCRRELLNLKCSINYDSIGTSSRWGKAKAHAF